MREITNHADSFKKAFSEYADKMQEKIASHGEMTREQLKRSAQKTAEKPCRKKKQREKSRENIIKRLKIDEKYRKKEYGESEMIFWKKITPTARSDYTHFREM